MKRNRAYVLEARRHRIGRAVNSPTKGLGMEFGSKGIAFNAISSGPMSADVEDDDEPNHHRRETMTNVLLGHMGTPAEIGSVFGLLASDGGACLNAQMIQVNGGGQT
ncbi:SDR family oxidoreductase [Reyranella sp.]|uniref:SDR family oxidoreductase n=1 Tax=Reyranella sp. TaxID=1929291 RepID=UPI003F724C3D